MVDVDRSLRPQASVARIRSVVHAIQAGDDATAEKVLALSERHRALGPLALTAGAFAMYVDGLRLLLTNWRLILIQALPAMWLWLAMADLKLHALHGRSFHVIRGPLLIPIWLGIVAVTVAAFFLNATFAFAIARPGHPAIGRAYGEARRRVAPVLLAGAAIGLLLALTTTVVTRWGAPWFTLSLGLVVGAMMVSYIAVPSHMLGVRTIHSRRDRLVAAALGGLISLTVCAPPYVLGRVGLLVVEQVVLVGILLLAIAVALQAAAIGAVRAIKMSASLTGGGDGGGESG
jgi:hypothetical protein